MGPLAFNSGQIVPAPLVTPAVGLPASASQPAVLADDGGVWSQRRSDR